MLYENVMALSFIEQELWTTDVYMTPMTFIYEHDAQAYSLEVHGMCKYELSTSRLSKAIVLQTYRQVTRGHFRLRDKDGGHTIRSAVIEHPFCSMQTSWLSFVEPELWAIKTTPTTSLCCGNRHFGCFWLL